MLPQAIAERAAYMAEYRSKFADSDLVFFDPDNGIEALTVKSGRKAALKYVFLDEVAAFYGDRKSVLLYQQRPKLQIWEALIVSKTEQLRAATADAAITPAISCAIVVGSHGVKIMPSARRSRAGFDPGCR